MTNAATRMITFVAITFVVIACGFLYKHRSDRCVIYYHGAAPETTGNRALSILNPFRSRNDEANAEWLIRDLKTTQCEQIVRERLSADSNSICSAVRGSAGEELLWLDPVPDFRGSSPFRRLIYDLPKSHARLVVSISRDEVGWGVSTVSVIQ